MDVLKLVKTKCETVLEAHPSSQMHFIQHPCFWKYNPEG